MHGLVKLIDLVGDENEWKEHEMQLENVYVNY